ncbi:MAG: glycosyltransferase family 4 protein [Dysgonamonadaceae bacterium]|jgi:glycosyltransferase involved in cell wall biosynthesis|nr:glycosyltransferase family 4 protein [Dysgonamonadaceae bacterium]
MNILLIHQYFLEENEAGGSRFNEMTKIWMEQGHQVTVLAGMMHYGGSEKRAEYKGKLIVHKKQGNVSVWRCHVSETYNSNFAGRMWGYFSFVFSSLFAGGFKIKRKFDIIIVTSPPLFVGITAYLLSRIRKIPFVFEVRDLWPESAIDTGVLKNKLLIKTAFLFERFIYQKAALINVLTPAFRTKLMNEKNIPAEKIIFIPNAADFSLSDELLQNFDRERFREEKGYHNMFIITYVGAHGLANHLQQIIETAKLLEDTNVQFLLIGQGMEKPRLMELAKKRNCKNVSFLDPVSKQEALKYIIASEMGTSVLKKADTFKTIYSNKTFDYMSCKKPILMAIDGVSRELVENADAGIFIEPEKPEDFAAKIRFYLAHPDLLQKQGINGYKYAKKYFDRNFLAGRYLSEIQKMRN